MFYLFLLFSQGTTGAGLEMGQASSSCTALASAEISVKVEVGSGSSRWRGGGGGDGDGDLTLGLPDECLAGVFGKLGCHDRNTCSLVCRRWRAVDSKSRQRLVLLARSDVSPFLPALLCRFSSVSVLSLKCSRKIVSIDDLALSRIPTLLASLKKLKLKGCIDVTDEGLHAFSLHRPLLLTKLSFASCGFGAGGLISLISNCPSLQDLTLKRLRKLDAQNVPLSFDHPHRLERLCIKDLHNARLFIPLLAASKTLKALVVCRSSGNWDPLLESLQRGGATSVSEIQMENVQMGDPGLVAISASCPDLEVLYLSRASDCTDDGVSAIANSCRKLRKLHIDAWSRFGSRTIGDDGVLSIATRCSNLQEVVLMGIPVTVGSFNMFASNCPVLERMAICNTDTVGDSELAVIASKFTALKKLCIKNCPISDTGVKAVGEGCPSLVKLKVKRCRGVTQVSVSQLRLQRGSVVVSVDAGSMIFEEGMAMAEEETGTAGGGGGGGGGGVEGGGGERTRGGRISRRRSTSTSTNVVCSSRGALLLRSKFENALQLSRRSSSSIHAPR